MENDQTCEVQTMDSPNFLGLWVGLQGLKFGCCYTSHYPSMFSVFFFCVFDRELARPNHAIGIESDRRSHCSDIEPTFFGDQKPN